LPGKNTPAEGSIAFLLVLLSFVFGAGILVGYLASPYATLVSGIGSGQSGRFLGGGTGRGGATMFNNSIVQIVQGAGVQGSPFQDLKLKELMRRGIARVARPTSPSPVYDSQVNASGVSESVMRWGKDRSLDRWLTNATALAPAPLPPASDLMARDQSRIQKWIHHHLKSASTGELSASAGCAEYFAPGLAILVSFSLALTALKKLTGSPKKSRGGLQEPLQQA
jgi:hypothetical protein